MKDKLGKMLLDERIKIVLPHIEGKLLDIGCGTNELVKSYSDDGIGVDVYQWGKVDVVIENTANLPFNNKTFDSITIIAALNHIPNRKEVLVESNRVLKDDGKLIITMIPPKISKIWHGIRRPWDADQNERGMKEGEVYGFTHKELTNLLNESGFKIEFRRKFMLGINNLIIAKKDKNKFV